MKTISIISQLFITVFSIANYRANVNLDTFQTMSQCDQDFTQRTQPFQVSGQATLSIPPEQVVVVMGLDVLKPTADEALQNSATIMQNAINAIKALGVLDEEIGTSQLTIGKKQVWRQNNQNYSLSHYEFLGYEVTQTLTITTKLTQASGKIIDAGISNLMNRVNSVTYQAKPSTINQIKQDLMQYAIKDAKLKANSVLKKLDYQISKIKSVSLNNYNMFSPQPGQQYRQYKSTAIQPTKPGQVQSFTQVIQANVDLSFLIVKLKTK